MSGWLIQATSVSNCQPLLPDSNPAIKPSDSMNTSRETANAARRMFSSCSLGMVSSAKAPMTGIKMTTDKSILLSPHQSHKQQHTHRADQYPPGVTANQAGLHAACCTTYGA